MRVYIKTLRRALKGEVLVGFSAMESAMRRDAAEILRLTAERDRLAEDYAALVAECKRHRDETWRLTHRR